jgi:hypothetical protein
MPDMGGGMPGGGAPPPSGAGAGGPHIGNLLEKLFGRMEDYIESEFPSETKARIKIVRALKTLIEIATRDDTGVVMHDKIKFLVDQVQDESASAAELKAWDRAFFPHKAKACGGEEEGPLESDRGGGEVRDMTHKRV